MFTCADLPSLDGNLEEIVDQIPNISPEEYSERYFQIEKLGSGAFGVVIKVVDTQTNQVLALKNAHTIFEVAIPCLLNSTSNATDCIQKIVNWFQLENTIYFTSPVITGTFSESFLGYLYPDELISLIFEIVIAIKVITDAGICHCDVHLDNCLIDETPVIRIYTINSQRYVVRNRYIPIIIDYGNSKIISRLVPDPNSAIYFEKDPNRLLKWDWSALRYLINMFNDRQSRVKIPASASPNLLLDPIFQILIDQPIYEGETVKFYQEHII